MIKLKNLLLESESSGGFKSQTVEIPIKGGYNNEYMLKQIKAGKKEVLFLNTVDWKYYEPYNQGELEYRDKVLALGFKEITFKNKEGGNTMIMHANNSRAKEKATRLAKIAKKHGGFLRDKTEEEAREIGRILDYREEDIDRYVKRKGY